MRRLVHWANEKWWLKEEYALVYRDRVSVDETDRAVRRVAAVFDEKWQAQTERHPIYYWLLSTGLMPLEFLYGLGTDLIALDGCLRLPSVLRDLRQPGNYGSALLEVHLAAHLNTSGHQIEFRPAVPNGKESDFIAILGDETVYFEIKRLEKPRRQQALHELIQSLSLGLSDLTRDSRHPSIVAKHYEVSVDENATQMLGKGWEVDEPIIESLKMMILNEIVGRAERGEPLSFEIPSVAQIRMTDAPGEGSGVSCSGVSPDYELNRILKGHFLDAMEQLHPQRPGIVVVQTPGTLDSEAAKTITSRILAQLGPRASHVSAVLILPELNWMPTYWSRFRTFVVLNRSARVQAEALTAFSNLRPFLDVSVKTPVDWQNG